MTLLQTLNDRLTECRRARQSAEMGVLQVVLGEIGTIESRTGKKMSDDEVEKQIRKTMLANQETLALLEQRGQSGSPNHAKLTAENALLVSLLPRTMSVEEIVAELAEVADSIRAAKNDGQATGAAMKHL